MESNKADKFTLVINSLNYFNRYNASISDQDYTIDNTNIPSGKYKCRFAFRSNNDTLAISAANSYASIYLSVGTAQNNFICDGRNIYQNSQLIGFTQVIPTVDTAITNRAYCVASYDLNTPFYLNYKIGSTLRVTLRAGTLQTLYNATGDYLLMIEMVKID